MKKKRRWLKALIILLLVGVVAVVVALFVVTRSSFICGVVLPKVSEAAGTPISAQRVRLSLFSEVEIRGLTVGPADAPLLRVERVECGYEPLRLLSKELRVTRIRVENAVVCVKQEAVAETAAPVTTPSAPASAEGGGSATRSAEEAPASGVPALPAKPVDAVAGAGKTPIEPISIVIPKLELPVSVNITDIMIRGVDVLYEAPGTVEVPGIRVDLKGLEVHIPRIQNGKPVDVDVSGTVRSVTGPDLAIEGGRLVGTAGVVLDWDLNPDRVELTGRVDQLSGDIGGVPLNGRVVTLKAGASVEGEEWVIDNFSLTESANGAPEAVLAVKGRVGLTPLAFEVAIAVDPVSSEALNLVGGLAGGYTFGKATAGYTGTLTMDPEMVIHAKGEFFCRTLTVGIPDVALPEVPPVDVTAVHDVTVSLENEELIASQIDVHVKQEGRETVMISLSEPLTIRWAEGDLDEAVGVSKATVAVDAFPLSLVNLFLGRDSGIAIRQGTLDSKLDVGIRKLGRQMTVSGPVKILDLSVLVDEEEITLSAVETELALVLDDFEALDITSIKTRVLIAGQLALQSGLTGKVDLGTLNGTVALALKEVNQQLLAAIPDAWLGGASIPVLAAKANVTASFRDSFKAITAKGTLEIPKVKASYPGFKPFPTLAANVDFDALLKGTTCELKGLDVVSLRGGKRFLHLAAHGTIPVPITSGEAMVTVSSKGIDLEEAVGLVQADDAGEQAGIWGTGKGAAQLLALAGSGSGVLFAPTRAPAPTSVKKNAQEEEEPGPIDLGGLALTAQLALTNLTYSEVKIGTCDGSVRVADNKVIIKSMDLDVNGGKVNVSGDIDLGVKGFKYALRTTVTKLPFEPFVATFAPKFSRMVTGSLDSFELGASGAGLTMAGIAKSLTADTRLDLGPIGIRDIPELTAWADKIKIPELRQLQFDSGALEGGFEAGKALIKSFAISGRDQAAVVTGSVGLDQVLDLSVEAGVGGKVAERLKGIGGLQSFATTRGSHAYLPVPIRVTGTIADPKIDFTALSKDVIVKFGLGKANQLLEEELGGETAKAVKGVLDSLPFPGKKSGGDAGKPKDIVGGLLGVGTALLRDEAEEDKPETPVSPPVAPQPAPDPTPAPAPAQQKPAPAPLPAAVQTPQPATPEAPLSDEERHRRNVERRQKRRKELEDLGGSLLRGLLKSK